MPSYLPSQTVGLTPLNPTVSVSGIFLATKRSVSEDFAGRVYGKSTYEDFCSGPQVFGQQEFQYRTRWYIKIDKKTSTLFSEKEGPSSSLKRYTDGLLLYAWDDISSVSMDFDEIGLPCVAFERSGVSSIRRLVDGLLFKFQFSGKSPRLMSNNSIQPDTASRDLVCFYLDTGILKYRIQRDNFSVDYQPFSGSPIKFDFLYKAFADPVNFRYSIFARGLDGLDYKLNSLNYPASPANESDKSNIDFLVYSGSIFDVVTEFGVSEEPESFISSSPDIKTTQSYYRLVLNDIGSVSEMSMSMITSNADVKTIQSYYRLTLNDIGAVSESPHSVIGSESNIITAASTYVQIAYPFTYTDSGNISFSMLSGTLV